MKKILITGKNSYIGTSFEQWMNEKFNRSYQIDTLDMRDVQWQHHDFSSYDVLFHVAGIAHADISKVTEQEKQHYYKINRDLTIAVAQKYKTDRKEQSSQFIFMSSIIVYGEEISIHKKRVITKKTIPNPSNFYGDSKWQAEQGLQLLETENLKLVILRPPMIYGINSKGNYRQLEKIAMKTPIFPNIKNERSMLSIENLCQFIKDTIDQGAQGIFFPQENTYIKTSEMVKQIAQTNGKNIYLFSGLNWFVRLLGHFPGKIGKLTNKAFGNLVYEQEE